MNAVQKMIERHAYLSAGVKHAAAAGRDAPSRVLQELQRLETRAQAMLTPQELNQALHASMTLQSQHLYAADTASAVNEANLNGFLADKLAQDLTGLTPDQLEFAKQGKRYAVNGKGFKAGNLKRGVERLLQGLGQKDMDFDKFETISDQIEDMQSHGRSDEAIHAVLREHFGPRAGQAKNLIEGYQRAGLNVAIGLQERRGGHEPDRWVEPSESDQMRAQLADAWAKQAQRDPDAQDAIISDIDPAYLNDENMTGDVARAMAAHDIVETERERENWAPASYDADELKESEDALSGAE